MKNILTILLITSSSIVFSQRGNIYADINYNTFSHSSLKGFQQEFKDDLIPISVKTVDDFPANIGFTFGVDLVENSIGIFGSYNFTGGKISYSDYSGNVKIEQRLNAYTVGGIYYVDMFNHKNFKLGLKAFSSFSSLKINSYSEIANVNNQESLSFKSIDYGGGAMVVYEYPVSFFILRANIGFDFVIGGKLIFDENKDFHLENNANTPVKTGWAGLRSGIGISIPIK